MTQGRVYTCSCCGAVIHRDLNGACNICSRAKYGLYGYVQTHTQMYLRLFDGVEPLIRARSCLRKQEPHGLAVGVQPGGQSLYSAQLIRQPTPTPIVGSNMGITTASAHGVPSDWYQVATSGNGQPMRLTLIWRYRMYAHLSPDGKHVAFIAQTVCIPCL